MSDDDNSNDDPFNDQLGNALSGRVGKRPEGATDDTSPTDSTGDAGSTGATDETSTPGPDPDPTSTRSTRTKYPIYLTEEFQDELNQRYKRMNAQRIMDDEPEIEKHKHFLEAVLRAGLERDDLDDYVEGTVERYSGSP